MSCLTIFLVVFAISSSFIIADDPCRFESTKGVIDLTSLGRTNGTAAYPDVIPSAATNYSTLLLFFSCLKISYMIFGNYRI
jgi:hypothetical protein